jgi:3,4-dihydroxy 2-butanone 4-phosphate synthase/GTP cyclohydrolase II
MDFDPIEDVLEDVRAGKMVIVTDDANRENEGDLIFAAEKVTPDLVAFMVRYTSGVICVPMLSVECDRLDLPLMTQRNRESMRTAFTISVDAKDGITTGISAEDRARTIALLADPHTQANDLVRPGHIFPLRYREGGVLSRAGHTEAAVDLARLAGLSAAGVLAEVVNDDGTMARLPNLIEFKLRHGLRLCSIENLIAYRSSREKLIAREEMIQLPTDYGDFRLYLYKSLVDGGSHIALVHGDVTPHSAALVRVHRENPIDDLFGSRTGAHPSGLHQVLRRLAEADPGILIYLRQEGRGPKFCRPSAGRHGEIEQVMKDGFHGILREYGLGAQMLADLGVHQIRLLTNNPKHVVGLDGFGLEIIEHIPMP